MGTSQISASGRYLLGDSPAEIRHLVEQAEVYAHEATDLFDLIGVDAGGAAIDIGCGVLGVLHCLPSVSARPRAWSVLTESPG